MTASSWKLARPGRLLDTLRLGWQRWPQLRLLAVASAMTLPACVMTPTTGTDSVCLAFAPITFSASADSTETVRQIREHNAAWRAICDD